MDVPATDYPTSPAQSKFVADKLETVAQELIDLWVVFVSTLNEFDLLHAKYEEALRTLAELQDAEDEARHPGRLQRDSMLSVTSPCQKRPSSFLSEVRSSEPKDGHHYSSSRSLSSELSSAIESPATMEHSAAETLGPRKKDHHSQVVQANGDALAAELDRLRRLAAEKEATEQELADKYAQLEQQHHETLDMVEELKTEVAKAQAGDVTSPRNSAPIIRRKSSQNVMIIDRAHRSFASLRNIAAENFEGNPDVMQNFELNLNAAMHELHARAERIQELEADVASAKKEMETKMTIISGLTRERSSLKGSPMDISVVSTLRDQLEKNEKQLKTLQDAHGARANPEHEAKIKELETELASWEGKHQTTLESMLATEEGMKKQISELETQLESVNSQLAAGPPPSAARDGDDEEARTKQQQNMVKLLRDKIDEYKAIINSNAAKVAELETGHATTKAQLDEASRARDEVAARHDELVGRLESQVAEYERTLETHQQGLEELRASHARDIEAIRASSKRDYDEQLQVLMSELAENIKILESDRTEAHEELMKVATQVAFALNIDVNVKNLTASIDALIAAQKALAEEQTKNRELQDHVAELSAISAGALRDLAVVLVVLGSLFCFVGVVFLLPCFLVF